MLVLFWAEAYSQGTIGFANNPVIPVVYKDGSESGTPVGPEVRVGLYYSSNLNALPGDLVLVGTTDIVRSGLFSYENGRPLRMPVPVVFVIVEIRAWTHLSGSYATYEDALASGDNNVWVGTSGFLRPMELGGPMGPFPNLFVQGGLSRILLAQVPEPSTLTLTFLCVIGAGWVFRRTVI